MLFDRPDWHQPGPAGVFLFNVSRRPLFYLVATSRTSVFNFLYPDHNCFFTALGGTESGHQELRAARVRYAVTADTDLSRDHPLGGVAVGPVLDNQAKTTSPDLEGMLPDLMALPRPIGHLDSHRVFKINL